MAKAFRLLCEPYVHVIIIAVVLFRLAAGTGGDGPQRPTPVFESSGEDPFLEHGDYVSARLDAMFPPE